MDLSSYVPFYWTVIANRWTASSSRTYLHRFDIGVVEWRVLATLSSRRSATVLDVAQLTGMDMAASSRAATALIRKDLVEPVAGRFAGRSRPLAMTPAGCDLFARVDSVAGQRLQILLQDLSEPERATLLDLLRRIHARLPELGDD